MKRFWAEWGDLLLPLLLILTFATVGALGFKSMLDRFLCAHANVHFNFRSVSLLGFVGGFFFYAWMLVSASLMLFAPYISSKDKSVETRNKLDRRLMIFNGICAWMTIVCAIVLLKIIAIVLSK